MLAKAGRSGSEGLPAAFWLIDSYDKEEDRQAALTACAHFLASLDRQVVMYDGGAQNYWEEVSAAIFGSVQDREYKDGLKKLGVHRFFGTDAAGLEDIVDKATLKRLYASDAWRQATKQTQKAIAANVDFLIEVKGWGAAITAMQQRFTERARYAGHYNIQIDPPQAFTGDAASNYMTAKCMKGDLVNAIARSTDSQYTGGLGSFFKKAIKGVGKLAKGALKFAAPVLSAVIPGGSFIAPLLAGGRRSEPGFAPQALPPPIDGYVSQESPAARVLDPYQPQYQPTAVPPGVNAFDGVFVSSDDPRMQLLFRLAEMAMAKAGTPYRPQVQSFRVPMGGLRTPQDFRFGGDPMLGDVASPTASVAYVELPAIQPAYVTDNGTALHAGDVHTTAQNSGLSVAEAIAAHEARLHDRDSVERAYAGIADRLRELGFSGDPATDIPQMANYAADRYIGAFEGAPAAEVPFMDRALDLLADALGIANPVRAILHPIETVKSAVNVAGAAVKTLFGVADLFAKASDLPRAFKSDSRFMKLAEASLDSYLNEDKSGTGSSPSGQNPPPAELPEGGAAGGGF